MSQNHTLSNNTVANITQALFSGVLSLVLYRYVNDTLGVAYLGVWSIILVTISASRIADLGLSSSMTRFVALYSARNAHKDAAKLIETALLSIMPLIGILLPIFYLIIYRIIPHLLDTKYTQVAQMLLPYAFISLGLNLAASIILSALDGLQRMDLRSLLNIVGQLLMVVISFWLIPDNGLLGLGLAQVIQGMFLLISGWLVLRGQFIDLPKLPRHWSYPLFREMLAYGTNVQVTGLLSLFIDPLTKVLMVRFGGVDAAGYFEIANQLVLKVRTLIVAANQAIVPRITQALETAPEDAHLLYRQNLRVLIFIALPIFTVLYSSNAALSWILLGQVNSELVFLLQLSSAAWAFSIIAIPAYFFNQGSGRVGLNTLSATIMVATNIIVGFSLGLLFGMDGVAWAYAVSLLVGNWFLIAAFQRSNGILGNVFCLQEYKWLIVTCLFVIGASHIVNQGVPTRTLIFAFPLAATIVLAIVSWMHPMRREISDRLFVGSGR